MGSALASLAMSAFASGAGVSGSPAQAAIAPEDVLGIVRSYRIPSGSMAAALNDLADANGLHVAFPANLTDGLKTPGLLGSHSVRAALDNLLAGTRLSYELSDNRRTVLITLAQNDAVRSDAGPEALPPIDVGAQRSPARGSSGVGTGRETGYVTPTTSTGSKMDIPNLQLPASVKVVPREALDDQAVTNVKDALENVAGVRPAQTLGTASFFYIRGFQTGRIFRNGLLTTSPSNFTDFASSNIERIEVLKGPDSMLYGRSDPGGLINLVTKRPVDEPIHRIEQRFGSYAHYFTEWDLADSLTEDKSVLYRFSGGYVNSGSFRDFGRSERVHLNPSVTFRLTPDTTFTVDVEYYDRDFASNYGLVAVGNRPANLPVTRTLEDPNQPQANSRNIFVGSELTHRFNDTFTFKNRFLAAFLHGNDDTVGRADLLSNGDLLRLPFSQWNDSEVYSTNLDLLGHFDVLGSRHDTLVGFDYQYNFAAYGNQGSYWMTDPRFTVNIYNPWASYGAVPASFYPYQRIYDRPNYPTDRQALFTDQKGVYFQDHITLFDGWAHILGGGRYDWAETGTARGGSIADAEAKIANSYPSLVRNDEAFSPRVGLLVQPLPWASIYGSWTTAFGQNNGVDKSYRPVAAQQSEQVEIGVKAELFDRRLTTTLAVFNLEKSNVPTRDLTSPDPTVQQAIGKARSKGVEWEANGKILDNVSVLASFTYMDARVTKDNTLDSTGSYFTLLGHRLSNIPRYSGSAWVKWDVKEIAALDGLSLGFGAFVVGNRQGDAESTFQLPGYVRLDALAAYKFKVGPTNVTAQLNLRNLANTRYFESTDANYNIPRFNVYPGAPFTAVGSIRLEF
jgi:iron complex outermembrane receptor protein